MQTYRSHTSYLEDILGNRTPRTGVALSRYTFLAMATNPCSSKACMREERATSADCERKMKKYRGHE
jgi:hypothetical protein